MKIKLIRKLIYLTLSIGFGIWFYHSPLPVWMSNTIVAVIIALSINKELNKISEDGSKAN